MQKPSFVNFVNFVVSHCVDASVMCGLGSDFIPCVEEALRLNWPDMNVMRSNDSFVNPNTRASLTHSRWEYVLLIILIGTCMGRAADAFNAPRWALLDKAGVVRAAAEITAAQFPDCDEAIVDKKNVMSYRADGTGESQEEVFTKVLTEKGKRGNRTLSYSYMLPYSKVEAHMVEVIKPDGKMVSVDVAANSKEMVDDSQMGMNIYDPNMKILRVNVPGVEVGDMIHAVARTQVMRSIIPGETAEYNMMEYHGFILHQTCEVYAPKDKPLQWKVVRDEVPGTIKYASTSGPEETTVHRWEANRVPRMFPEPDMPSSSTVLQRVLISTTPDWPAVSKWYWNVCLPHLDATNAEMKRTVESITAHAKTDLEKTEAVFYYVSQKIRYMGITPEKDRPGFEPHDVRLTFDNKYGVCRDKAALLVSMLRLAGLRSYPILILAGMKKDAEVPDAYFNHAIVAVEDQPGQYTLMDPTDENTKDLFPAYLGNWSYLVARPEGDQLRTTPVIPAEKNLARIKTAAKIDAHGTLSADMVMTFEGVNDNAYRGAFAQMKPDDKRRMFEGMIKETVPGARLTHLKIIPDDMLDTSVTPQVQMSFVADHSTVGGNGKSIVTLPWIGKRVGIVSFILGGAGLDKRKYPLLTGFACGVLEEFNLQLESDLTGPISLPTGSPIDDPCLTYRQSVQFEKGKLTGARMLSLKVPEFSPSQYLQLKGILKSMEYDERKQAVLAAAKTKARPLDRSARPPSTKPAVESDTEWIDHRVDLEVNDDLSVVRRVFLKKKILNYSGKKSEAEFKIPFNPACQEARIVKASVIGTNSTRQELTPQEINLMDAAWNASAKRYTGGKILVANLPGVDMGSVIEMEYEIKTQGLPLPAISEPFQLTDQLDHKLMRVSLPEKVAFRHAAFGPAGMIAERHSQTNGRHQFEWEVSRVNAMPAESGTPPRWAYAAQVWLQLDDPAVRLTKLHDALLQRTRQSTQATALAQKLTANTKTRLEALQAIRDHLAKSIRQGGPSFRELPLTELSSADTTLADGYGHNADRAILLYAMLAGAGFAPEFIFTGYWPDTRGLTDIVKKNRMLTEFDTLLVRVALDGQVYYLNDTDQYARLGSTDSDGKIALRLASQTFDVVQPVRLCADKTETQYAMALDDRGTARITVTQTYFGSHFDHKKRFFSELPPEERRRYHQTLVSEMAQGARSTGDLITHFDEYPGREEYAVEIDQYAIVDGAFYNFRLPYSMGMFGARQDERVLPLFSAQSNESNIRAIVSLPPGFTKVDIAPPRQVLRAPEGAGVARIESKRKGNQWEITAARSWSPAVIQPGDYPELVEMQSALSRLATSTFLLEK
jgi:transglutaminase-like putative cysteine protease